MKNLILADIHENAEAFLQSYYEKITHWTSSKTCIEPCSKH